MSSRQLDFKMSFHFNINSVLTAVSKKDVYGAFSTYSDIEKESLYLLFVQVTKSLHADIAELFESTCQEIQLPTTFDKIEHLVEEQALDNLHATETTIKDTRERLSTLKSDEIQYLQSLLLKVEEHNCSMETQIQSLEKNQEQEIAMNALKKLRSWNSLLSESAASKDPEPAATFRS